MALPGSLVAETETEIYQLTLDGLLTKVSSKEITQAEYDAIYAAQCDIQQVMEHAKTYGSVQTKKHRYFHNMLKYFQILVSPLNRYSDGIDAMAQANPMASLVWGALRTILLVAHDLEENFEVIVDGLQQITDSLPNHHAYHAIIITEPENPLRPPLIRIYVETLTYSILATRYLKGGILKVTGKAILRSETHGFKKCIDEIRTQSSNVNALAIGDIWRNTNATMEELKEAVKEIKRCMPLQPSRQSSYDSNRSIVSSNVPSLLSNTFVARESDLNWITSALQSDSGKNGTRRAAVYGMTGVGKTQLILKYEERNRAKYVYRFWITSGSHAKVRTGVQEILDILDLPERQRSEDHVQDTAIRAWLERTDDWLLMFDNVTEEGYKAILALLPQGPHRGDILFTSQRPGAMDKLTGNLKTRCLRLEELGRDDAVHLFHLAGDIERTEVTERDAEEIVKSNGFLPQAINQAASYIKNTDISLPEYLKQFKHNAKTLLDYKNDWDERQAISASMQISLDSLKRRNKNSLNLLKLFAYFEPESIPPVRGWKRHNESSQLREEKKKTQAGCLSMFSCFGSGDSHTAVPMQSMGRINSGFQASSESVHMILKDDPSLDDALSQLRDFSLIKALPESHKFWMHDLTRYFVQQSIPVGENVNWLCLALEVLFHTFPERDGTVEERTIVDVFLPQAESLIVQARNAGIPLQKYAKLISICGVCFHDRFSYAKALEMFEIARPIYEKQLGMKNEKTLTLLHRIGWCHRERGDLSLSEKYYSQTLASRRKILPPDSLDLFISMSDLASVIERQGRLKEAEVLFEKCYESQKLALGSSHRRTLAAAHNLALCYANQGRVAAGERVCQTTLKLSKEHYGDDDPGTLRTASNLAVFIDHQGRLAEALPIYEESLKGYKRRYGYNHVLTMRVRSNLAGIWRLEGKFKEAEAMLREVMSELIRLLGHDHVHVCIAQFDLAEILHEEGKVEEAQDRYSKAITIFEFSDPKHPVLFRMVDGLGILYREMGNLVQADTMTERAYNENMNLLKWHDPYTLMSAHSRAEVFQLNGRLDDAQKLFEKCLESFSSLLGQAHPHIFMTRNSLGCLELRKRKFDRAIRHFEAAKTGYSAFVGEKHVCVMIIQINLSRAQLELGKLDLATTSVQSAKDGLITVLGSEHPHVAVAEFYLGLIAARQGDLQGARSHYLRSIELYKLSLGDTHPNCIRAAIELLKVLAQLNGEEDECVTWLSTINDTMPALHEMGCIESKPKALTMEDFKNPVGSTGNWSASDGLPWGESARLRWGRKSVWREADEGTLTG